VPGHRRLGGNEIGVQLSKLGTEWPFMEPTYGISVGVAKESIRHWTNRDNKIILGVHNSIQMCKGFPTITAKQNKLGNY
jgi:hypothetical protein